MVRFGRKGRCAASFFPLLDYCTFLLKSIYYYYYTCTYSTTASTLDIHLKGAKIAPSLISYSFRTHLSSSCSVNRGKVMRMAMSIYFSLIELGLRADPNTGRIILLLLIMEVEGYLIVDMFFWILDSMEH